MPFINRELSWLDFNLRVLEEAEDTSNPLLERLRFLGIFSSNLDEFFMVRVGSLQSLVVSGNGNGKRDIAGLSPAQQHEAVLKKTVAMMEAYNTVQKSLFSALASAGIIRLKPNTLLLREQDEIRQQFLDSMLPLVSAIIVDPKHPFPYLPGGTTFLAARLKYKNGEKLGLMLYPEAAPHMVFMPAGNIRFFLFEDAALRYSNEIFPKHEVLECGVFRVTRSADLELDDDALPEDTDYTDAMARVLEQRKSLKPVRLQSHLPESARLSQSLARRFNLVPWQVIPQKGPLDLRFVPTLIETARRKGFSGLHFRELKSVYAPGLKHGESVIRQVRQRDHLLIHPYVNFDAVLALLREAAHDPTVIAVRQTLYRISSHSEVVRYLAAAAQNGKEVTVAVELKARFDEASNLSWAAVLEDAGCRVIYGGPLKVHAKLLLITRSTSKGLQHTAHVSTGNYNENTARQYGDIGLLTARREIADDIVLFFRELCAGVPAGSTRLLDLSPDGIRRRLCLLIDAEITAVKQGGAGRIVLKANSLADKDIMDRLIAASRAGVKVDLIIRGICSLKAGVPGLTENIRVTSIVGRFLEHARIYWFAHHDRLFISSADLLPRNLNTRMEVLCPVLDTGIVLRLKQMLLLQLRDVSKGRRMLPDGRYTRLEAPDGIHDSQLAQFEICALEAGQQHRRNRRTLQRWISGTLIWLGRRFAPH